MNIRNFKINSSLFTSFGFKFTLEKQKNAEIEDRETILTAIIQSSPLLNLFKSEN